MRMSYLKKLGNLDAIEIRSHSFVFCLVGPGIYAYSLLIGYYNSRVVELPFAREFFSILFLSVGLLPYVKLKRISNVYGLFVFGCLALFQAHLTYTVSLNNFSIDYLLGAYIVMFGSILMLNNRKLLILFSAIQFMHMSYRVMHASMDSLTEGAILVSTAAIFFYSFIIINGSNRYRTELLALNEELEYKIKDRTKDLEYRAKELYEKNKDLEEFAYVVSHDLKRPLRNIHTLAEWLTDAEDETSDRLLGDMEYVTKIKEQVQQMELLVNGILNYSLQIKKEQDVKQVSLQKLVNNITAVNRNDSIRFELKNELPVVWFNESQLLQLFQNLIQNAIKHNDKEQVHITIDAYENEEEYVIALKDNGPGIAKKYHEKVFQLFQKLDIKPQIDSIGIGLALVKKIIERNGGRIWLESEMGEGTTFFLTIRKSK